MTDGWWVDRKQFSIGVSVPLLTMVIATVFELPHTKKRKPYIYIYIYINKDGNPSTISTRHEEANVIKHTRGKPKQSKQ